MVEVMLSLILEVLVKNIEFLKIMAPKTILT